VAIDSAPLPTGGATISVINASGTAVRLKSELRLQHLEAGVWKDSIAEGIELRPDCTAVSLPDCQTLAPGETFKVMPWSGLLGDAGCMCVGCGPAPAGRYRIQALSCDGTATYSGNAVDVVAWVSRP
jgi:hypothetical protein